MKKFVRNAVSVLLPCIVGVLSGAIGKRIAGGFDLVLCLQIAFLALAAGAWAINHSNGYADYKLEELERQSDKDPRG